MKKIRQIIVLVILVAIPLWMNAQPPHPNGGNAPGQDNTPVGGGGPSPAPLDGGLSILLALGLAYGGKKVYQVKRED